MKEIITKIVKTPKGYKWIGTTRLSKNRIEEKYVLVGKKR